jgi:hypothetical protein
MDRDGEYLLWHAHFRTDGPLWGRNTSAAHRSQINRLKLNNRYVACVRDYFFMDQLVDDFSLCYCSVTENALWGCFGLRLPPPPSASIFLPDSVFLLQTAFLLNYLYRLVIISHLLTQPEQHAITNISKQ